MQTEACTPQPPHDSPVLVTYSLQVAWYVHGFFESLIVDKFRSDFIIMLVHHVLSSVLLLGAYWGNAHRVAILVCVEQVRAYMMHRGPGVLEASPLCSCL